MRAVLPSGATVGEVRGFSYEPAGTLALELFLVARGSALARAIRDQRAALLARRRAEEDSIIAGADDFGAADADDEDDVPEHVLEFPELMVRRGADDAEPRLWVRAGTAVVERLLNSARAGARRGVAGAPWAAAEVARLLARGAKLDAASKRRRADFKDALGRVEHFLLDRDFAQIEAELPGPGAAGAAAAVAVTALREE